MYRPYRIFETEPFARDPDGLASSVRGRLEAKLREHIYPILRQEPHLGPNIKRLRNWEPLAWRYRIGDWRLFYEINESDRIVYITAVEHRKEAHR